MKHMNRIAALALLIMLPMAAGAASKGESIELKSAKKTILTPTVDGAPVKVRWYVDNYVTRPNRPEDQLINIYVPENATKASPIIFIVNNGGWRADEYPDYTIQDGRDYDGAQDKIGVALKEGYVVVSYGCRSRADGMTDGKYLGHSPATMTDTKAAIRYLRYNRKALPAGDPEKIVITGTSGGGALSTVIAASGNSSDYYPSLYEIGAAGIVRNADGTYSSKEGMGDNVFAVIGYCPITDLGHADAAYEWLFHDVRKALYMAGKMDYEYASEATVMSASRQLAASYSGYVDGLWLKDENGNPLNSSNLAAFIERLMRKEIDLSIKEYGIEQMQKDIECMIRKNWWEQPKEGEPVTYRVSNGWLKLSSDGSYTYDFSKHLYYTALYTTLKAAPSFSNFGLYDCMMNEDSLFGSQSDDYSPFEWYSWNNDTKKNSVGKDDTGMTWDEFMKTDEGKALAKEIKMTCAMDYLLENTSDTAPYWYVRHGMDDRDTSWAIEATLFASVMNSPKVKGHNVGFAWLKPHSGDYDVPEAYSWLKSVLQ